MPIAGVDINVLSPTGDIEIQRNDSYACLNLQDVNNPYYSVIPLKDEPTYSAIIQSGAKQLLQTPASDLEYYVNEGLGPPSSKLGISETPVNSCLNQLTI